MKKFLALYVGKPMPAGGPPDLDEATIQAGMKAWGDWMGKNQSRIVEMGGPLSKTKSVGPGGVTDIRNSVGGYVVITAESHDDAANLFLNHPHFTIFPGDAVEVMEVLPIPGM